MTGKPGRFELAEGGTLFLDEIGDTSPNMQAKLLRVLQEKEFERVGGRRTIKVDVRILAATNRDLKQEVEAKRFREDLYYRLNVVPIHLPPLRERREDIPALVDHFLHELNPVFHKDFTAVSPEAMACLLRYPWPGNVRELRNIMEKAILLGEGSLSSLTHLPEEVRAFHTAGPVRERQEGPRVLGRPGEGAYHPGPARGEMEPEQGRGIAGNPSQYAEEEDRAVQSAGGGGLKSSM